MKYALFAAAVLSALLAWSLATQHVLLIANAPFALALVAVVIGMRGEPLSSGMMFVMALCGIASVMFWAWGPLPFGGIYDRSQFMSWTRILVLIPVAFFCGVFYRSRSQGLGPIGITAGLAVPLLAIAKLGAIGLEKLF